VTAIDDGSVATHTPSGGETPKLVGHPRNATSKNFGLFSGFARLHAHLRDININKVQTTPNPG